MLAALDCLRCCPDEVEDTFWSLGKKEAKTKPSSSKSHASSKVPPLLQETTGTESGQRDGLDLMRDGHQQKGDESRYAAMVKTPSPPTKWEGRLWSRAICHSVGTSEHQAGEM